MIGAFMSPPTETIFVRPNVDISGLQMEIAELKGTVRGYEKGIAELIEVARKNKELALKNAALVRNFKATMRELIATGHITKDEAQHIHSCMKKTLSAEDQEAIDKPDPVY